MPKRHPRDEDYPAQVIPDSLAILVYCSAQWKPQFAESHASPTAVSYLLKTFHSVRKHFGKVVVYVADEEDRRVAEALPALDEVVKLELPKMPHPCGRDVLPLPVPALIHSRPLWRRHKYVYYSEADQTLLMRKPASLAASLDSESYLVPHRFERLIGAARPPRRLAEARFRDRRWVLRNTLRRPRENRFFAAEDVFEAYGAAWLCRSEFLDRVDFSSWRQDALRNEVCVWTPMTVACHRLMDFGKALKTSDPLEFFVEHLSALDNGLAATGVSIADCPGYW